MLRQLHHTVLKVETALFFKLKSGGEEFRAAPIAYIESLSNFVYSLLEENER